MKPDLKSAPAKLTAFALFCALLSAGCDSPVGETTAAQSSSGGRVSRAATGDTPVAFPSDTLKFQEAVLKEDREAVNRYISPAIVNLPIKGYPPVYYMALTGNIFILETLLRNGASVKNRFDGHSLAYVAASLKHVNACDMFIAAGGGTEADLIAGGARYAGNSAQRAERAEQAREAQLAALAMLSMLLAPSSQSSSNSDSFSDRAEALHHQNDVMRSEGVQTHGIY